MELLQQIVPQVLVVLGDLLHIRVDAQVEIVDLFHNTVMESLGRLRGGGVRTHGPQVIIQEIVVRVESAHRVGHCHDELGRGLHLA